MTLLSRCRPSSTSAAAVSSQVDSIPRMIILVCRVRNGKNPFLPDKNHIHHKLLALGIKQRNTMIIIVSVSTIFILLNILLSLYLNVNWIVLGDILIWTLANIRLTKSIAQLQSEQKTNK